MVTSVLKRIAVTCAVLLGTSCFFSCDDPPTIPVDDFTSDNYRDYFFENSFIIGKRLEYKRYSADGKEYLVTGQRFTGISSSFIITFFIEEIGSGVTTNQTEFIYEKNSCSIKAQIGTKGLFSLPSQIQLVDSLVKSPDSSVEITAMLSVTNDLVIAGTEKRGIYRFDVPSETWLFQSIPNIGFVNCFAKDSSKPVPRLYAGTKGNGIYCSSNYGRDWIQIYDHGDVREICTVSDNALFAVIDNSLHYSLSPPYGVWKERRLDNNLNVNSVTYFEIKDSNHVYIGTEAGVQSLVIPKSAPTSKSIDSVTPRYYFITRSFNINRVLSHSVNNNPRVTALSSPNIFFQGDFDSSSINGVSFIEDTRTGYVIKDIAFNSIKNEIAFLTNAGLFSFGTSQERLGVLLGKSVEQMISTLDNSLIAHSGGSLYRSETGREPWEEISKGLKYRRIRPIIRALEGPIERGNRWDAAEVKVAVPPFYTDSIPAILEASILDHFEELFLNDSLVAPGYRKVFSDVWVVRYAIKDTNIPGSSEFYTVVYYAKGIGPVLIEEIYSRSMDEKTVTVILQKETEI